MALLLFFRLERSKYMNRSDANAISFFIAVLLAVTFIGYMKSVTHSNDARIQSCPSRTYYDCS